LYFPKGSTRSATFQQLEDACVAAQAKLGDGYVLVPDYGEGVEFFDWPNKRGSGYKTVRFLSFIGEDWPCIRDGEVFGTDSYVAEAKGREFGPKNGNRITTRLKAFYGAPVFTKTELDAVMSSLASCYDGCKIIRMPSNAKLQKYFKDNRKSHELCQPHSVL